MTFHNESHKTKGWRGWLARHTRLAEIADTLFDEPAQGLSLWARTTAGIVFMLLLLQVVTGVLLAFYYVPSAESAHTTVAYIEKVLPAGSWIRALHHYGSQWLTLFLVLHLVQMFWRASYSRKPVGWIACVFLLALVLAGGATGYSLPWDARAFFGTRVAEGITGGLPLIGETARRWLLGGTEISTLTVSRFFALHVLVTPLFILLVIAARLFIFREGAVKEGAAVEELHSGNLLEKWKLEQLARHALSAGLVFLALALYALKYPAPIGPEASEATSGYLPRPGAQFLWLFQMLKYLPGRAASTVAALLPGLIFAGLALLPFLDARRRRKSPSPTRRRLSFALVALGLTLFALLTALAYIGDARDPRVREQLARQAQEEASFRAEPFEPQHPPAPAASPSPTNATAKEKGPPTPDNPPTAYMKQCANCHGAKGQGVKPFPKLLGVSTKPRRTVEDIIGLLNDPLAYGIEPPMKSFATKLTDEEKREIAEWVVILKKK
jgi:ubiquinol-cytochrome c reductase cytochrome b subunit